MTDTKTVTISISKIVRTLGVIIAFLLFASITVLVLRDLGVRPSGYRMFYVDKEANIPTYFSSMQLFVAAALLSVIAMIEYREGKPFARHWTVLALGFFLMSVDEISQIHESLVDPMRALLGTLLGAKHLGLFYFAWVIPAIIGIVGLGLYYLRFLGHLPKSTRWEFVVAAVIFLGGAVVLEMVGGRYAELHGDDNIVFYIETNIEEGMEMVGILIFIRALLRHLAGNYGSIILNIQTQAPSPTTATGADLADR